MQNRRWPIRLIGAALAVVVMAPALALAQTSITQARALAGSVTQGDAPGYPITISRTGSYRLDSNLEAVDGPGIVITAPDVTIDFNGFNLDQGAGGFGCLGFGVESLANGTTLRNGTITGSCGIELPGSANRVERMVVALGDFIGISVGPHSHVLNNVISLHEQEGIQAGAGSVIIGNIVSYNDGAAIITEGGCTVLQNTLVENIYPSAFGAGTGYGQNVINDFNNAVIGGIQIGTNICGGATCPTNTATSSF
jgi:hypothetical protein